MAQFSLDLLLNQYWELFLACQRVPDHISLNGLNEIDASING